MTIACARAAAAPCIPCSAIAASRPGDISPGRTRGRSLPVPSHCRCSPIDEKRWVSCSAVGDNACWPAERVGMGSVTDPDGVGAAPLRWVLSSQLSVRLCDSLACAVSHWHIHGASHRRAEDNKKHSKPHGGARHALGSLSTPVICAWRHRLASSPHLRHPVHRSPGLGIVSSVVCGGR